MSNGPIEPAADLREMANILRQYFIALTQEGFTEHQALQIIGTTIAAGNPGAAE